jgi:hypothetical protein
MGKIVRQTSDVELMRMDDETVEPTTVDAVLGRRPLASRPLSSDSFHRPVLGATVGARYNRSDVGARL